MAPSLHRRLNHPVAEPGRRIGPYTLLALLGQGAMGEVWRARDERLDREVAVKLLTRERVGDPAHRARLLREARAAAQFEHPNIVRLYDIESEQDEDALVMELVAGQTVAERLRSGGPLPVEQALELLLGLTDALAGAHARGILHRDIKAANLMLDARGQLRILDFGLAKIGSAQPRRSAALRAVAAAPRATGPVDLAETLDPASIESVRDTVSDSSPHQTVAGSLVGTPMYMAPEQLDGASPDALCEVYSVGVVAYEMVVGHPPYRVTSFEELCEAVATDQVAVPDAVPPPVREVITRATARHREERTPRMAALHEALLEARTRLRRRRARWPVLAGAAALALVAGGVAWRLAGPGAGAGRTAASGPTPAAAPQPAAPGDRYVERALEEYDLFYNDKAAASLRAALAVAPDHPRAHAYLLLFGAAGDEERLGVAMAADRIAGELAGSRPRDAALARAAAALGTRGPAAAREAIPPAAARGDRELAFWRAELAYQARLHRQAEAEFRALLAAPGERFRGRIYDHHSAVLLYHDRIDEALEIGELYARAFPGEADALGVYATTLAAAGQLDDALAAATQAARLREDEDTLAGLAKVHAYRGELSRARDLYARSMALARDARRPLRRAALALMHLQLEDTVAAREVTRPCLPGGTDDAIRERGPCLFVAGLADEAALPAAITELEALARAGTPQSPPYGEPDHLADLLRARAIHWAGGCVLPAPPGPSPSPIDALRAGVLLTGGRDFFASYHLPFFHIHATCERAALTAASGAPAAAVAQLDAALARSPAAHPLALRRAEITEIMDPPAGAAALARLRARWPSVEPGTPLARRLRHPDRE